MPMAKRGTRPWRLWYACMCVGRHSPVPDDVEYSMKKDGNPLDPEFKNTWGVRLGAEMRFPYWDLPWQLGTMRTHLRGGFGYEPTPLVSQTQDSALLDSDRILFACGLGAEHASPLTLIDSCSRFQPR